jgi:hypothetical protein
MRPRKLTEGRNNVSPPRVAWSAYLLADDLVYNAVSRSADAIQKKTGLGRKALAYSSFIAGTAATTALLSSSPAHASMVAVFGAVAMLPLRGLVEKASEFTAAAGALAKDSVQFAANLFFRAVRLPAFVWGGIKIIEGLALQSSHDLAHGTFSIGFGITAFLVSSSSGMLEKARDFLAALRDKALSAVSPEPAPVRVR